MANHKRQSARCGYRSGNSAEAKSSIRPQIPIGCHGTVAQEQKWWAYVVRKLVEKMAGGLMATEIKSRERALPSKFRGKFVLMIKTIQVCDPEIKVILR